MLSPTDPQFLVVGDIVALTGSAWGEDWLGTHATITRIERLDGGRVLKFSLSSDQDRYSGGEYYLGIEGWEVSRIVRATSAGNRSEASKAASSSAMRIASTLIGGRSDLFITFEELLARGITLDRAQRKELDLYDFLAEALEDRAAMRPEHAAALNRAAADFRLSKGGEGLWQRFIGPLLDQIEQEYAE